MKPIVIEPWPVDETTHEFFVPDYIIQLAEEVLKHYDLSVQNMQIVTTKPDKGGRFGNSKQNLARKV